jgi:phosphatidylglycerophosphate synthase
MTIAPDRRPMKARSTGWARALAALLARAGASPDLISAASVAFAALGGALFVWAGASRLGWLRAGLLAGAALTIQLRLLANMLDGLVAVEHGRGSAAGPIWNELPDRIADALFLAGAGYAVSASGVRGGIEAGWIASVLAVLTAYVRELGRGLGFAADFSGPFAKPQRMGALTLAALVGAVEPIWGWRGQSLMIGLVVIALGTALTLARRTRTLARRLAGRQAEGGNS